MVWLGWALLSGCEKLKGMACGPEECADICAAAATPEPPPPTPEPGAPPPPAPPTEFEQKILDATLADVRKGIQPWDENAIGICKGRRDCDKFLGVAPGPLGRGAHFVMAQFRVPPGPAGTWSVTFQTDCKTPTGEDRSFEREYDVTYAGPDMPFKLWPLRPIDSPSAEGAESCVWTLTTHDPAGDKKFTGELVGHREVTGPSKPNL